jgi:hypothetical protein
VEVEFLIYQAHTGFEYLCDDPGFKTFVSLAFTVCGKSAYDRHSERSEESLFGLNPRKEGFLGTQRASE